MLVSPRIAERLNTDDLRKYQENFKTSKNYSLVPSPPQPRHQSNFRMLPWEQGCSPSPKIKILYILALCRKVLWTIKEKCKRQPCYFLKI